VLGAKPRTVTRLEEALGKKLSDPAVARIVSEAAYSQCKPLENVPYEAGVPPRDAPRVHAARGRGDGRRRVSDVHAAVRLAGRSGAAADRGGQPR
jgi:hypothetical protein